MKKSIFVILIALSWMAVNAQTKHSYDIGPGATLELEAEPGGEINIQGWDRDTYEVTYDIHPKDRDVISVSIEETNNGLRVLAERLRRVNNSHGVDFTVKVPFLTNTMVKTSGGDVTLRSLEGTFKGKTGGGNLEFSNLIGEMDFKTMGGNVSVFDSELDGKINTMGGNMTYRNVTGHLDSKTMGGNVSYDNVAFDNDGRKPTEADVVRVETMGGNVSLSSAPYGAQVKTMGGNISIERAGMFVRAKTMGGNIAVRELDGSIDADTMGGRIDVNMIAEPTDGRDVRLVSKGGDIRLRVPKGMGLDLDIEVSLEGRSDKRPEITGSFDLPVQKKSGSMFSDDALTVKTSVNGGGHKVYIRTINSDVKIIED